MKPNRPIRAWFRRALAVTFGLGLSLGLLEAGLRIGQRHIALQPDPELMRSLRPNVQRKIYGYDTPDVLRTLPQTLSKTPTYLGMDYTNNQGLRMKEDVGPKAPGERRILFLGDSFVDADNIPDEQRFYRLVQGSLDASTGGTGRWRIINAAIPGGSPSQYILQLRRYLAQFEPEIVLVFLGPNDLTDDLNFERAYGIELDSRGVPLRPKARLRLWLLQESWALRYLAGEVARRLPAFAGYPIPGYGGRQHDPPWLSLLCGDDPENQQRFLEKTGRYVATLKEMTEARAARFGVFLIHYMYVFPSEPFYEPGYPGLRARVDALNCLKNQGRSYQDFIERFLESHGMRYQNPFKAMLAEKTRDPKQKLWNYHDHHFSPNGHRIMATEVLTFLRKAFLDAPGTGS